MIPHGAPIIIIPSHSFDPSLLVEGDDRFSRFHGIERFFVPGRMRDNRYVREYLERGGMILPKQFGSVEPVDQECRASAWSCLEKMEDLESTWIGLKDNSGAAMEEKN
jgi:hypothetical protein